jgi:hypothetical protein
VPSRLMLFVLFLNRCARYTPAHEHQESRW